MDYGTILVIQYIIVIPTAIFALFFMPRRGTLATPLENLRRNSAIFSLLPCGPISIGLVLLGAGIYYAVVRSQMAKEQATEIKLKERVASTQLTGGGANPIGQSSSPRTMNAAPRNPFSVDSAPRPQGGHNLNESNPFS